MAPSNRFYVQSQKTGSCYFVRGQRRRPAGPRRRPRRSSRDRLPAAWARVLASLSGSLCDFSFSSDARAEASAAAPIKGRASCPPVETHAAPRRQGGAEIFISLCGEVHRQRRLFLPEDQRGRSIPCWWKNVSWLASITYMMC